MPINPNIALGIQPVQQPNMLAQYGQMMALKAAQQETEGYEGVQSAIAGGMSPTDPRMLQYGPRGIAAFKAAGEGAVKQQDFLTKSYANARETLNNVRTPEDLLAFSLGQFNDPAIGPALKARGLTPESVAANLQKELSTSGFNTVLKKSAMGLDRFFTDETSRYSTNVAAGTAANRLAFDKEGRDFERANPTLSRVDGENGFYLYNPRDPNSAVPLGMRPSAPPPVAQPSAVNNMLITPGVAQPSVNALTQPAPNQPSAPTVANANVLNQQPTIIRPKQTIRQPVAVIKDGEVTLVPPEQAVGMTPATPGAEKALEKKQISKEGKQSVNGVLNTLYSEYDNLVKSGGITDTRRSTSENFAARTGASAAGQLAGSFSGSEAQTFRDTIEQTRPLLLTAIMKATGLSTTQLNSNVELQTYLNTATDPKVSIQSNVKALNNISQMFGIGEKFEVPEIVKSGSQSDGSVRVTLPDGSVFNAPNAEAAEKFKKAAGIK